MDLDGKWALVTGAGRGIGKGCALQLAKRGANLILNDRPGSPDLESTVTEITSIGRKCHAVEANVFERSGCEELVTAALEATGRIDILISNPAFSRRCSFLEYPPELFEQTLQGTLLAGFHVSQLVARHMVARGGGGKIVFISSVQAYLPIAHCVAYGAAKNGLNHMMRTVAVELFAHHINVNAIEPGWIDTPGEHEEFGSERIEAEAAALPWGRLGTPEDIGKAAAFLSSDDADYVTGTIVRVDGGFVFRGCARPEVE
tara:strand:- start:361 stop:1137 length:777 start_codon:yes stop_codon:yes gene_type:complete